MTPTAQAYRDAFALEREATYPALEAFEQACGFALERPRLEAAAAVLACPVKARPPCWQHGRLIYSAVRAALQARRRERPVLALDIGTAKGFSALCLRWALDDAGHRHGRVISLDVIDPQARVARNTIADVDGLKTLAEILASWPEAQAITFRQQTGIAYLQAEADGLIDLAFVDGKHTPATVAREAGLLARRQPPGGLAIFDDLQLPGLRDVVDGIAKYYRLTFLAARPDRAYALGIHR